MEQNQSARLRLAGPGFPAARGDPGRTRRAFVTPWPNGSSRLAAIRPRAAEFAYFSQLGRVGSRPMPVGTVCHRLGITCGVVGRSPAPVQGPRIAR
ncbi:unnamed protein product [Ixodes hexagonus]